MTVKHLDLLTLPDEINIKLPASKSISNRVLILNALAYSPYDVQNLANCDDTNVLVKVLNSNDRIFDIGAAGTSMRFLTAFLSKTMGEWTITGSERMKNRPIALLVDALNSLGAHIEYIEKEGYPPLRIFGSALLGGEISMNGGVSSQYISALMMIAPYMQKGLRIKLTGNIVSMPYIHMTMSLMKDYGVHVNFEDNVIEIAPQTYTPIQFRVESDWSAASYWYEMVSVSGKSKVYLEGLKNNSSQGDSKVAELFGQLGVNTQYKPEGVVLTPNNNNVDKFDFDFVDQPDLAQTFAVTCCLKNVQFHFKGVQSLKIKETDRVAALIHELAKAGYILHEPAEGELAWKGQRCDITAPISIATYEDHRMAMAFAPIALLQPINIENPQVGSKSYPGFWNDIDSISKKTGSL